MLLGYRVGSVSVSPWLASFARTSPLAVAMIIPGDTPRYVSMEGASESAGGDPNDPDRGSNDPKLNNKEADKILREKGYRPEKQLSSQGNTVYYNPKGQPKYLVRSNTSHRGDAFKGYNSPKDIKLDNRAGSYDVNLQKVGK
ncbi:MAG: hypothetical protein CVV19_21085 [Gammaproteobacteria bacterium HGW-Gammaproteobacteria-9]|nr:MAG: hypothetical protein CVV19_21085 [Gammaproteobacteria bacterium HGW-Gammaproteobacteria-9]